MLITCVFIRDSFSRHIAGHSNPGLCGAQNTRVACDACYRSKVRCERGPPCFRCTSIRQKCTTSRTIIPTMSVGRAIDSLAERHAAAESQIVDAEAILPGDEQQIHTNDTRKVLSSETVQMGVRASSITRPLAVQSSSQRAVSTMSFGELPHLPAEPRLPPGLDDLRRLS